ncbi:MAG: hypothetical protein ABSE63_14130 [Thermoguttaceae bacterium]|jgi:hypothetical protein
MFLPFYTTFPLAEQDRMQDLFRAFRATQAREGMGEVVYGLMILAGIVVVMFILSVAINHRRQREGYTSPLGLFLNLCRAHRLKWRERWLLWRLARIEQFSDPARLFLEPEWFASSSLPVELRQHAAKLKNIRDRLFADMRESLKASDEEQSDAAGPIEPAGAALPTLKAAPELDIAPWSATAFSPPLPPFSNTSNGAPV